MEGLIEEMKDNGGRGTGTGNPFFSLVAAGRVIPPSGRILSGHMIAICSERELLNLNLI